MSWVIRSKDGSERAVLKSLEYNGEWLGECYVTATLESPVPVGFEIGDWLEYRGERFEINYDPGKIKAAPRYASGDAFRYENIKFNSLADELTRCDFLDVVPGDNQMHFTGLPIFSFYAATIRDLAERIQANLDRAYPGLWTVEVHPEFAEKTDVNVAITSPVKVWDALGICVSDFKAYFTIKGRRITIGTAGVPAEHVFRYGKGKGLYEIEQTAESDQAIVTRVRAYGSTRNMPHRYYNSLSGADGKKLIPDNMAVQHLMLPEFPYTTLDPYIDSANKRLLGVREGTVFFDGSENELDEIYPSIEGMTAEDVRAAGLPCASNGALDVILVAEQMSDDGVGVISEDKSEADPPTFKVWVKDLGFDINEHLTTETAQVSFKTGMLGGRDFDIVECAKEGEGYVLELNRVWDDSIKLWFPYAAYNAKPGDKFVLLHIEMPEVYIKAAAQRLKAAAETWLSRNDYSRSVYAPKVDEIFMARQHDEAEASGGRIASLHDTLKEGMQMMFEDDDLNIDAAIIIDRLTIKEGESPVPEYEIVLKEEKTVGTIEKIQNQIDSLAAGRGQNSGGGYTAQQIRNIVGANFLSKIRDDRSTGAIASDKGFEVGRFLSGVSGAWFGDDAATGQTLGEVDRLFVRVKAYFETLTTIEANTLAGKQYITPGGSIKCTGVKEKGLEEMVVTPLLRAEDGSYIFGEDGLPVCGEAVSVIADNGIPEGVWRCYFLAEQDGDKTECKMILGDMAISEMFNATVGTVNGLSNHRYWRKVVKVNNSAYTDENGNRYGYIDLSKDDCEKGSGVPKSGDVICQLGNDTDATRQAAMIFSTVDSDAPSIKLFTGIDSYKLSGKDIISYGFDPVKGNAYFNCYGDTYIGDRDGSTFVRYNQKSKVLDIKARLNVESTVGGKPIGDYVRDEAGIAADELKAAIEELRRQSDGVVESFYGSVDPEIDNAPASGWLTPEVRERHAGDVYVNIGPYDAEKNPNGGCVWQWYWRSETDLGWEKIGTSDAARAIELARLSVLDTDVLYIQTERSDLAPELPKTSSNGTITDLRGWSSAAPAWREGWYIWQTTYVRKGDGGATFSGPTCISGRNGMDGVPGEPGADGTTYYTWIRYADDESGSGMSNDPRGKKYIGFAYNKLSPVEGNDPSEYMWSRIEGEDGVPGAPGADGKTYYTWIKYSDMAVPMLPSHIYDIPTDDTRYIGIAVNKESQTESTDPKDYTWSLFHGADGEDGVGIDHIEEEYYLSTSRTELLGGRWTTIRPVWIPGRYYWTRSHIFYTDGTDEYVGAVCVTGNEGSSVYAEYSSNGVVWHPAYVDGDVWMRTSTDGVNWSPGVRIAGIDGTDGADGADGMWRKFQWAKNESSVTAPETGWQDTPMTGASGEYVWMRSGMVMPPATEPSVWEPATRLTGDRGLDGESVYMLDLTNEVAGVVCDADGNVTGAYPTSVASVWRGGRKVISGVTYSIAQRTGMGWASVTTDGIVSMGSMSSDSASVVVQAVTAGVTLLSTINVYKVRPGADGEDAKVYSILPSVDSITRNADGSLSVGSIDCEKRVTSGTRGVIASTEYYLYYKIVIGSESAANWVIGAGPGRGSMGATALPDGVTAVIFELRTGNGASYNVLDRERVPVLTDAAGVEVGGANLLRNTDFLDGMRHWNENFPTEDSVTIPGRKATWGEKDGRLSVRVRYTTGTDEWRSIYQTLADRVVPGKTYSLSGWVLIPSRSVIDKTLYVRTQWNTGGSTVRTDRIDLKSVKEGEWVWVSCVFTTPATMERESMWVLFQLENHGEYYLNGWKLEEGNVATSWSASPEDVSYLRVALRESSSIDGGLVAATMLKLGFTEEDGEYRVTAGMNGAPAERAERSIAFWSGGEAVDAEVDSSGDAATVVIRHDGSAYFCGNTVRFDSSRMEIGVEGSGQNVILDGDGLKLVDGIEERLRVVHQSVGDLTSAASSHVISGPTTKSYTVSLRRVGGVTSAGGLTTTSTTQLSNGFTTGSFMLGSGPLPKGAAIKMDARVSFVFATSVATSGGTYEVYPLSGVTLRVRIYRSDGTVLVNRSGTVRTAADGRTHSGSVSVNATVNEAGIYYAQLILEGKTTGSGTAAGSATATVGASGSVQLGFANQTVLGNDGLMSMWGESALLVNGDGVHMRSGAYEFIVRRDGIYKKANGVETAI